MFEDSQLQEAVLAEINWEPSVIAAQIGVMASGGVITLTGSVASFAEKCAAETAARRVRGVRAVAEEIEVRLPFDSARGDGEIAAAILERLSWDVSVPADKVTVKVEKGWVTLTGELDWHYQREAAEQDVRRLHGVTGVLNQTTVKPRIDTAKIADDIMFALHRSWFFDGDRIRVSADGGSVRLSGTVATMHERALAATTAWSASGTTSVDNEIVVA